MGDMRRDRIRAAVQADRDEAARLVRLVAEPATIGESIKSCITRAASRLDWDVARTQAIWRREARRIDAFEMDKLREFSTGKGKRRKGIPGRKKTENYEA
jgi:hypothetical protein